MARNNNIRVLFLCSGMNKAGGLERIIVQLSNLLADNHYAVSLFIADDTPVSFYTLSSKISVFNVPLHFGITPSGNTFTRKLRFVKDIIQLKRHIKKMQPDIVISTEYPFAVAAILGGTQKFTKVISWEHAHFFNKKSSFWQFFVNRTYKRLDAIVCLNETEKKLYQQYKTNVWVIPNFITAQNKKAALNNKVILTIARTEPAKGYDFLVQAAAIVLQKYPDWTWKAIGKGSLDNHIHQQIKAHHLEDRLVLTPPASEQVEEAYQQSSLYVLTSLNERFPMVLLEAMSHGLPCIAFDCETGPRHIITNNVDGILVAKENSEKLAEAISLLIEDKEKRCQMGKAAFENVQRFSSEIILQKWEALFNQLLHNPSI